jgi:hypothetical protein
MRGPMRCLRAAGIVLYGAPRPRSRLALSRDPRLAAFRCGFLGWTLRSTTTLAVFTRGLGLRERVSGHLGAIWTISTSPFGNRAKICNSPPIASTYRLSVLT